MKHFILKNKLKLISLGAILVLLGISILVGILVPSIKFFELVPVAILLGFGFTSFLKKVLPIKNILSFISISIFLGLFLNTFVIFLLGTTGLNIGIPLLVFYIPVIIVLNVVLFFRFNTEDELLGYLRNTKLEVIDIVWIVILTALFLMFAGTCLERFYFLWDGFTFWVLDAKYIFENQHFRDGSFILLNNNYMSFFSLQINYVYLIYGKIVEQTAGLLNLMYAYTGIMLIFSYLIQIKKSNIKKILIYLGILAALYAFFTVHYLLMSVYSDVFLSVVVLFYAMILFNKEFKEKYYWQRFLLLVMLAAAIYLTKTHFFIFSLFLVGFLFIYDFKYLWNKVKNITKDYWFVFVIFLIILSTLIIGKYAKTISSEESFVQSVSSGFVLSKAILTNVKGVVKGLILNVPLIVAVIAFYLPVAFLVKKGFTRNDFIKIAFLALLVSFTFVVYILGIYPISDGSMYRYLGLAYMALPFLFIDILPDFNIEKKWQEILTILVMLGCVGLIFVQLSFHIGVDFKFTPNSGAYIESEAHKEYSDIVDEVKKIVPESQSIMIASYGVTGPTITDNFPPGFFLRYYLMEYNKTVAYYCSPVDCLPYFLTQKPDYLLIYSYSDFWPECRGVLEDKKSYLIKFDFTQEDLNNGKCLANESNTTAL
jgi:hypothetical protein